MIILALLIPRSRKSGINIELQTLSMRTKAPKRIELSETTFSDSLVDVSDVFILVSFIRRVDNTSNPIIIVDNTSNPTHVRRQYVLCLLKYIFTPALNRMLSISSSLSLCIDNGDLFKCLKLV